MQAVLIANRGEVAIRIARGCADLGLRSVAAFTADDAGSLHVRAADAAVQLPGAGPTGYLDGDALVAAAIAQRCDAVHPGYGFLSERANFATRCADAGLTFVGPSPETLALFGDKARARAFAAAQGVPLLPGIAAPASLDAVQDFFDGLDPGAAMMIKAVAGGGGRGMRVVRRRDEIADAYARCRSEAQSAFGDDAVFAERLLERARHIEVQVIGDGTAVAHLHERDCSLQRRHQKLLEIAPAPWLSDATRAALTDAALRLAAAVGYRGLGTVEFLLDADAPADAPRFAFLEVNPRLQVEHTVTEEVCGVDLVQAQLRLAAGETLAAVGLANGAPVRGTALQLRVNLERVGADGGATPSAGTLAAYEPPSGPGVRVDGAGYAGYATNPRFDPLLAKLIVSAPTLPLVIRRATRALDEFWLEGVETNIDFLRRVLADPALGEAPITTDYVARMAPALAALALPLRRHVAAAATSTPAATSRPAAPPGSEAVVAPMAGLVIDLAAVVGDEVRVGQCIAIVEAMKMEHEVRVPADGRVVLVAVQRGATVETDDPLLFVEAAIVGAAAIAEEEEAVDLDADRADVAAMRRREALIYDDARPDAMTRRRASGLRTARENVADLLDPDSFSEYGALVVAAQRRRRSLDDLRRNTPADGLIAGIGTVNAQRYGKAAGRCMVLAYDATVLAGTQGWMNHKKTDRMLALAGDLHLPLVLFGEGGGGRPGDTDIESHGLEIPTFHHMARLSGQVPLVAVVAGRCFAGNAALVGCCDVVIATRDSNLGMGGPAMIEGGGLGVYPPEAIGPAATHAANGVVDLVAADEAGAVALAKRYLSYFQGSDDEWTCADQRRLRWLVPENRVRSYDVRGVIDTLADAGSVLELRAGFGIGILTALVRVEGRPIGLLANNARHLGGAIDGEAAGKAARFVQLCDAFALPVVNLIDTPGFMVGPAIEETAQVRRVAQMLVTAASCTVPVFNLVLRKAYGLGALGIGAGGFHATVLTAAWPTGELGGMNLEGAASRPRTIQARVSAGSITASS